MTWQPGESGNPSGYNGQRNYTNRHKIHRAVFEEIKNLGHRDALITLSEIQNDPKRDDVVRVSAATALAPYCHPKLVAIPTPRYIATPFKVPELKTVDDAKNFLGTIPGMIAAGELDLDFAESLTKSTVAWLQLQYAEQGLDLKAQAQGSSTGELAIRIEGGLPALPGANVTMPTLNGHNGHSGYQLLQADNLPNDPHHPPRSTVDAVANDSAAPEPEPDPAPVEPPESRV